MRNIVFHTAFIGDLLLAIPFLRQIHKNHSDETLHLICRPGLGDFFIQNKLVDSVFELNKKNQNSISECIAWANREQVNKLYVPHMSFRTAWISRHIQARKKIGYQNFWNFIFFDKRVNRPMAWPEPLRLMALLEGDNSQLDLKLSEIKSSGRYKNPEETNSILNWSSPIDSEFSMKIDVSRERSFQTCQNLNIQSPYVIVAPGSQWPTKMWTESGYIDLVEKLIQARKFVYLVGSPSEKEICDRIVSQVESRSSGNSEMVKSLAGQTSLNELLEICATADWIVTNDSGPMHIAAAADRPVTAIFGPTVLKLGYRPWSNHSRVVQIDESCRPCGVHGHKKCPLGTHACMKKITAEDVWKASP